MVKDQLLEAKMAKDEMGEDEVDINRLQEDVHLNEKHQRHSCIYASKCFTTGKNIQ